MFVGDPDFGEGETIPDKKKIVFKWNEKKKLFLQEEITFRIGC